MSKKTTKVKKAVALRYDIDQDEAPVVVAKGSGAAADSIVSNALEHHVPVRENASLAEVLSKLELTQEIPSELYQLVAEVLSFVYAADQSADRKRG